MKRISFVLLSLLFSVACEQLPTDGPGPGTDQQPTVVEILDVSFGDDPAGTKATVHPFTGKVNPSAGDDVAVFFTGSGFVSAAITADQKVQVEGSGTRAKFAVFPAASANSFNLSSDETGGLPYYKITYPAEIDITGQGHDYVRPPMIAVNDPYRSGLRFFHMGGVIRFKLYAIPAGTKYIRVTSTSSDPQVSRPLSGDFPIYFDTDIANGMTPVSAAAVSLRGLATDSETSALYTGKYAAGVSNSVLIKIHDTGVSAETDGLVVNLPVPLGSYESFTLDALDASKASLATGDHDVITQEINWDCERALGLKLGKVLAFDPNHPITNPNYVPGLFSVSPGKQVWFAHGNLVVENTYDGSKNNRVWKFETNQWDYSFGTEGDASYSVNGKTKRISHFGWATAAVKNGNGEYAYDVNHKRFYPHNVEASEMGSNDANLVNLYRYGPSVSQSLPYVWAGSLPLDPVEGNSWNYGSAWNTVRPYCDWGVHFNAAGEGLESRTDGTWYTLSAYEWNYLLGVRENYSLLMGHCQLFIEGENRVVSGLFILPDNWEKPSGCKVRAGSSTSYADNQYTTGDSDDFDGHWSDMEAAGAVFLPAAGERYNDGYTTAWDFSAGGGNYWSSSNYSSLFAYTFTFSSGSVSSLGGNYRCSGQSVRLVHDNNGRTSSYSPFSLGFQPIGGGEDNL